jgi:hypothetical protein
MTMTLRPHISTTNTDDGMVLLDERTGRYFQLDPSGALILDALVNGAELPQAARLLTERYTVTHDRALADVTTLIDHLRTAGLVTP